MTQQFASFRDLFPVFPDLTYMDVGSRAPLPKPTFDKLESYLRQCMLGQIDKSKLFDLTEETRARFARLIHADPVEVTFTKNISEGLNILSSSVDWKAGDNVIVCPDLEHPNNVYHWLALARRGVTVRTVDAVQGEIPVDRIISAMDSRTRVVSVSTVTFCPGFKTDLEPLGRACRQAGTLLVVDAAQSVGILDTDVQRLNIDVLAASTQKGLLALYGMGFLYIRKELAESMTPAYLARFSVALDSTDSHESDFGGGNIKLMPGAKRFDLGNYNFPGVVAVHSSLGLIEQVGIQAVDRYVTGLAHKLAADLRRADVPVYGREDAPLAHTISVGEYGKELASVDRLYDSLSANDVRVCVRRNMIRFTLHAYNNENDIDKVIEVAKRARKG
jgi:cysteine desulfurase/selenocysteine lyase